MKETKTLKAQPTPSASQPPQPLNQGSEAQRQMQGQLQSQLQEFQNIQSQLQFTAMQLQQLAVQQNEADKAIEEIDKSPGPFYRYVANILVAKDKDALRKELQEEKETSELRSSTLKKQEERLRARGIELQKILEQVAQNFKVQWMSAKLAAQLVSG